MKVVGARIYLVAIGGRHPVEALVRPFLWAEVIR